MAAPDWPASVENIVASVAIVAGGGWAVWKWGYGETLRKRREFPDLDGTLTAASVPLPGGKAYLTLQAVWRNPGAVPVRVSPICRLFDAMASSAIPASGWRAG